MRRRLATAVTVVTVLAALAPAPGAAGIPKPQPTLWKAPLWATVTATQTTTWSMPKYYMGGDCWHRDWTEAGGKETVSVRSQRTKVLMWGPLSGPGDRVVSFNYGSWSPAAFGSPGLIAKGTAKRESHRSAGSDPGPCGTSKEDALSPLPPGGCGTHKRTLAAQFTVPKPGWIEIGFGTAPQGRDEPNFVNCPLEAANDVILDGISAAKGRAHFSALINRTSEEETIVGKALYAFGEIGIRPNEATTQVSWKLTLELPERKKKPADSRRPKAGKGKKNGHGHRHHGHYGGDGGG